MSFINSFKLSPMSLVASALAPSPAPSPPPSRSTSPSSTPSEPESDVAFTTATASTAGLKKYLMDMLDVYEDGSIKQTMALYWLFELIISQIAILETQKEISKDELDELHTELDRLLECQQVVNCLKRSPNLFYSVILNYANPKIYQRVATLIGDFEHLLRAHMYNKDYDEALKIVKDCKRTDLFYLHGHLLMKHRPKQYVDALIEQPNIEPSKLIPILIQENPYYNKCCEAIRYLEHCVNNLHSNSPIIHNTLFDLYARYRSEELLIDYLKSELEAGYLELQPCLRTCTELKLYRTCVHIYCHMDLLDEAVDLALKFDVELAKSIAKQNDEKSLWLAIAKKILSQKDANIEVAAQLLDESKLLKIEDVLIFFPDCKSVDTIEFALHQSLVDKRNEIIAIRDGTYESIANEIKREIKSFKTRYSKLKVGEKCELCSQNILSRSLYSFPCGHLFHCDCMMKEIMKIDPSYLGTDEKLWHEILSKECILCGSFLANCIDKPARVATDQ